MWKTFSKLDRKWALGLVGVAGMAVGVVAWGGFNTVMEATNSLGFCISCHEMRDTVYEEYKKSIHYSNPAGVRAICSDCHVPKDWTHKIVRKIQASGEVWGKLTGSIATPELFEAKRLELAKHEWARMKATDSRECRNCHSFEAMDFEHQRPKSSEQMRKAYQDGGTCIDCHKGIAHKLPDMSAGYKSLYDDLATLSKSLSPKTGETLYTLTTKPFFLDRPRGEPDVGDGKLLPQTPVKVRAVDGAWLQVEATGWQQEGAERMLYALQGKRIFVAALGPDAVDKVAHAQPMTDPDTDQVWTAGTLTVWMKNEDFVADPARLETYGGEMYNASCGLCHSLPPMGHYLANQWIGNLNAMKRFIGLDDEQYRFLQKYVQMHAQDTGGHK